MAKKNELPISTIIGKNCKLTGDVNVEDSIRIDGSVQGNIICQGTVVLGEGSEVNGNIEAQYLICGGKHNGNVKVSEKAEFSSTAEQMGDVTTRVITIDEDAVFQGNCRVMAKEAENKEENKEENTEETKTADV